MTDSEVNRKRFLDGKLISPIDDRASRVRPLGRADGPIRGEKLHHRLATALGFKLSKSYQRRPAGAIKLGEGERRGIERKKGALNGVGAWEEQA